MSPEFIARLIGTAIFALLGARLGSDAAPLLGLPEAATSVIFSMIGILVGLLVGPWLTIRPLRAIRTTITDMPVDALIIALTGLALGLGVALLAAYPLSLLQPPFGALLPPILSVVAAYLGLSIFSTRSREILDFIGQRLAPLNPRAAYNSAGERQVLLDTSVLIDGRIVDIAKTGFIGGTLVVPRFVINELHQVADSSDPLRRSRGRHGLEKYKELQRDGTMPFKIVEDEVPGVPDVDDKLVALATQMKAPIITNDYPLNQIAQAQGVQVLNVNALANAVRAMYLPDDTFPIRIIQEGREPEQGVGYLEDGTMVVVEGGKSYMDRTLQVKVTKYINQQTGRMYFAKPDKR
jgi:uncharacterized protein YacL